MWPPVPRPARPGRPAGSHGEPSRPAARLPTARGALLVRIARPHRPERPGSASSLGRALTCRPRLAAQPRRPCSSHELADQVLQHHRRLRLADRVARVPGSCRPRRPRCRCTGRRSRPAVRILAEESFGNCEAAVDLASSPRPWKDLRVQGDGGDAADDDPGAAHRRARLEAADVVEARLAPGSPARRRSSPGWRPSAPGTAGLPCPAARTAPTRVSMPRLLMRSSQGVENINAVSTKSMRQHGQRRDHHRARGGIGHALGRWLRSRGPGTGPSAVQMTPKTKLLTTPLPTSRQTSTLRLHDAPEAPESTPMSSTATT
jgi:hypothetical protein